RISLFSNLIAERKRPPQMGGGKVRILSKSWGSVCGEISMSIRFVITKGTESKVWTSLGWEHACFTIRSLKTGAPARAHFRRTRAGRQKDLDYHTGHVCWDSKPPIYVLYATAVDEDIEVFLQEPPGDWRPDPGDWRPGPPGRKVPTSMPQADSQSDE